MAEADKGSGWATKVVLRSAGRAAACGVCGVALNVTFLLLLGADVVADARSLWVRQRNLAEGGESLAVAVTALFLMGFVFPLAWLSLGRAYAIAIALSAVTDRHGGRSLPPVCPPPPVR